MVPCISSSVMASCVSSAGEAITSYIYKNAAPRKGQETATLRAVVGGYIISSRGAAKKGPRITDSAPISRGGMTSLSRSRRNTHQKNLPVASRTPRQAPQHMDR